MDLVFALLREPALPDHCTPTNGFLLRFSSAFHTCVPTPLAFVSCSLGTLSIIAWLFAQLPQIYKNWVLSSTSGLSIFFLVEWCLGDLGNLLGALFTHQASWQVTVASYYVFVDICLVLQWIWYEKLRHGNIFRRVWPAHGSNGPGGAGSDMVQVVIDGVPINNTNGSSEQHANGHSKVAQASRPKIIFRTPTFDQNRATSLESPLSSSSSTPRSTTIRRDGPRSPLPSPSPRTMLLLACIVALAQASPLKTARPQPILASTPTALETAGTLLSWLSTFLYLGSRLPQLWKNYRRKSTGGLSPYLFLAAFCGNLAYSAALLTNPNAWSSMPPYGGAGWAGPAGNDRAAWIAAALPFFLGAAGVLALDASMGVQFAMYADTQSAVVLVIADDDDDASGVGADRSRWRRVSGWMRGWVPSFSEPRREGAPADDAEAERRALLDANPPGDPGYGAVPR
nr:putative vacuolar amino acid transporter ypq1 [Quercus suber]